MEANSELTSFTTQDNKYTWKIPSHWAEYDDGEDGTFAFFNTSKWTGNLRITPVHIGNSTESPSDKLKRLIDEEVEDNQGASKINVGGYDCAHYKNINTTSEQLVFYWTTGKHNTLLICSFTIDTDEESSSQTEYELETVRQIISSIEIN